MSAAALVLAIAMMGQPATADADPPPSEAFLEYLGLWAEEDEATVVDFAITVEAPVTAGERDAARDVEEDEDDAA